MPSFNNRYKLEKVIGQGGMGKVYLATDLHQQQLVAIKECVPQGGNMENTIERIKREYYFLKKIHHPNLVKGLDFFYTADRYFLVMEYVRGITLQEFIHNHPRSISFQKQLQITQQICGAVAALNKKGVMHRDIKPSNIILKEGCLTPKLLDLGIAKATSGNLLTITEDGSFIGTPEYTSPEQVDGSIKKLKNMDVFSLGVVFYQFFTWNQVSPFYAGHTISTMDKVMNLRLPALISVVNSQRHDFHHVSQILEMALKKKPQNRISSTAKFYELLMNPQSVLLHKKKRVSRFKEKKDRRSITLQPLVKLCAFILLLLAIKFSYDTATSKDFPSVVRNLVRLNKEKKYLDMCEEIDFLDNVSQQKFFTTWKTNNKTETLIQIFYTKKSLHSTPKIVPEILQQENNVLGIFYGIRFLSRRGEISLMTWYSGRIKTLAPDFFDKSPHPILPITLKSIRQGHKKLHSWSHSPLRSEEQLMCQTLLDIQTLRDLNKQGQWEIYNVSPKLKNTIYPQIYKFHKQCNYHRHYNNSWYQKIISLVAENPDLKKVDHILYILGHLEIEISRKFSQGTHYFQSILTRHPNYAPAQIMAGNLIPITKIKSYTTEIMNTQQIKQALYKCILSNNDNKFIHYLYDYYPAWHFSHMYKGNIEARLLPKMMHFLSAVKINHKIYPRFQFYWLFQRLSLPEKIEFALHFQWFLHFMDQYKLGNNYQVTYNNMKVLSRQMQKFFLQKIQQKAQKPNFVYQDLVLLAAYYENANDVPYKELLRKYPELEECFIQHMVIKKQYNTVLDVATERFPLYKAISLLNNSPQKETLLQIRDLLVMHYNNEIHHRYESPASIVALYLMQKMIEKSMHEYASEYLYLVTTRSYLPETLHFQIVTEIHKKTKPHKTYVPFRVEKCNQMIDVYIINKQFDKARETLKYAMYLLPLSHVKPSEEEKLSDFVKILRKP